MTDKAATCPPDLTLSLRAAPRGLLARIALRIVAMDEAYRTRRALDRLDAHLRRDIGLTDTAPPRWNPPEYFLRK